MVGSRGFSLIELVVGVGLTAAVLAAVIAVLPPADAAFQSALEAADMQQRLRVAADVLTRDLTMAGAGAYAGGRVGPLVRFFAPVLPFRWGQSGGDPAGTFRTDTLTLISVPQTAAQTSLAADLVAGAPTLQAVAAPGCTPGTQLCGFVPGLTIAVYDAAGSVGTFTIASVDDSAAQLTVASLPAGSAPATYPRASNVVEARVDVYYLKADAVSQGSQLMHYDGSANADVPVVDHVVGLSFEFYGEPRAPRLTADGGTSYGPAPPAPGTKTTAYPAGENCAFRIDEANGLPGPRLPDLPASAALVPLTASQLTDGPWCPDDTHANRWDADLLRIRKVGVTLRVEAALSALRGPAGVLFTHAGTASGANRWAPDQVIRFEVSPRNMNLGRE